MKVLRCWMFFYKVIIVLITYVYSHYNGDMKASRASVKNQLKVFGLAVRDARAQRGWRQEELADRAGISLGTLRKIESGAAGTAFATILELCSLLNISADPRSISNNPAQLRHLESAAPRRVRRARLDPALEV